MAASTTADRLERFDLDDAQKETFARGAASLHAVFEALEQRGEATVTELAAATGFSTTTVGQRLTVLEEGFEIVDARDHADDARQTLFSLTEDSDDA